MESEHEGEQSTLRLSYPPFWRKMSQLIIGQMYPLTLILIRPSLPYPNGKTRGVQLSMDIQRLKSTTKRRYLGLLIL
jgi:hypothetical protein